MFRLFCNFQAGTSFSSSHRKTNNGTPRKKVIHFSPPPQSPDLRFVPRVGYLIPSCCTKQWPDIRDVEYAAYATVRCAPCGYNSAPTRCNPTEHTRNLLGRNRARVVFCRL